MIYSFEKTEMQMYCLKKNFLMKEILSEQFKFLAEIYLILHMTGTRTQN